MVISERQQHVRPGRHHGASIYVRHVDGTWAAAAPACRQAFAQLSCCLHSPIVADLEHHCQRCDQREAERHDQQGERHGDLPVFMTVAGKALQAGCTL